MALGSVLVTVPGVPHNSTAHAALALLLRAGAGAVPPCSLSLEVQTGVLACVGMLLLLGAPPPRSASKSLVALGFAPTLNAWLRPAVRMS